MKEGSIQTIFVFLSNKGDMLLPPWNWILGMFPYGEYIMPVAVVTITVKVRIRSDEIPI